jgi:2-succinyl-5-enolpyruvyl-6-hydroxy-3-cyclohexene-1-carboxylate synthase
MEIGDLNLACAWALVDGMVGGGVRHACVSPGSRSTPLALALSRHPAITVHMHLDERSSAFFAVGLARASGTPVVIACTSGTAAAEFLPAVVEASQSRVPVIAMTADRPPRLRGTGANQTIDQVGLYGAYARLTLDLPVPETSGQEAWWRQAAREVLEAAYGDPVGPVHVNCPFEEPLSPSIEMVLPDPTGEPVELPGRPDASLTTDEADRLAAMVSGARGAVVIGGTPGDLSTLGGLWMRVLGWPVLAEPTSNARLPDESLSAGQALLGNHAWLESHRPEVVLQLGAAPTTRATQAFVTSADRLIVADRWHLDPDFERLATWRIAVDPDALAQGLHDRPMPIALAPDDWTAAWRQADRRARAALDDFLDAVDEPFGPRIARDVAAAIPSGGSLFVGNSTPIRDLDLAMRPRSGLRVLANRGASGIDGLVSTALGIAADGPTIALLGELSFLYDVGAFLSARGRAEDLVIVVIANGGGEIFTQLPQRALPEHRELFVTPHEIDMAALARAAGAIHVRIEHAADLLPALGEALSGGIHVIEAVVDPDHSSSMRIAAARLVSKTILAGT